MTNRIFEQGNSPIMNEYLGYVKCSKCERVTAWTLCVMCGGNYATHNLVGKGSK
jgi:hypothetical protein